MTPQLVTQQIVVAGYFTEYLLVLELMPPATPIDTNGMMTPLGSSSRPVATERLDLTAVARIRTGEAEVHV